MPRFISQQQGMIESSGNSDSNNDEVVSPMCESMCDMTQSVRETAVWCATCGGVGRMVCQHTEVKCREGVRVVVMVDVADVV